MLNLTQLCGFGGGRIDSIGAPLFIASNGSNSTRLVDISAGMTTTVSGDSTGGALLLVTLATGGYTQNKSTTAIPEGVSYVAYKSAPVISSTVVDFTVIYPAPSTVSLTTTANESLSALWSYLYRITPLVPSAVSTGEFFNNAASCNKDFATAPGNLLWTLAVYQANAPVSVATNEDVRVHLLDFTDSKFALGYTQITSGVNKNFTSSGTGGAASGSTLFGTNLSP